MWLKRSPRGAIEPMFWGWGLGDFQNRPASTIGRVRALRKAKDSDDPTQLDKPIEVGSIVEHLPHCAVTQRELDASQLALLGQPVEQVG